MVGALRCSHSRCATAGACGPCATGAHPDLQADVFASPSASTASSRPAPDHDAIAATSSLAGHASAQDAGLDPAGRLQQVLGHLDLVVLPIGVAVALALGGPVFGLLVGAGGWLLQRALAAVNRRLIDRAAEPGSRIGLHFVDAFARIWLLAGAIIVAGVAGHRSDGLAAALVLCISYSVAFAVRIASGRPQGGAER
jgi:hypothetical protein